MITMIGSACFLPTTVLLGRSRGNASSSFNQRCNKRLVYQGINHAQFVSACRKCRINMTYAAIGDAYDSSTSIFPRINVHDPYQRLGVSREASQEEIQAARNYLIIKYGHHKPSVDAIESAHDKILMQSLYEKRNPKIDLKQKVREVTQSGLVKAITGRFEAPSGKVVLKASVVFVILGVLTYLFPTEEGPTLQVLASFVATVYFIYERLRGRVRAVLYGLGSFFMSWFIGTFLMVSIIPPLLQGPRSLEVSTSIVTYALLLFFSTCLK